MSDKQIIFIFVVFIICVLLFGILNILAPQFLNLAIYAIAGVKIADWIVELSEYIFNKKEK